MSFVNCSRKAKSIISNPSSAVGTSWTAAPEPREHTSTIRKPILLAMATILTLVGITASAQAACPPGKYESGNQCLDCPAGKGCPTGKAPVACPAGTFKSSAGASTAEACKPCRAIAGSGHGETIDCVTSMKLVTSTADTPIEIVGYLDERHMKEFNEIQDRILKERRTPVTIDARGLIYADQPGIAAIVGLYKRMRAQGGELRIRGLSDQPLQMFHFLRLEKLFSI